MIAERPLTIGEIFDHAVTLVVRRWRAVAPLLVLFAAEPAVRAACVAADPRFARHDPFAAFVLSTIEIVVFVFATAAIYRVFAADGDDVDALGTLRATFGEGWRLARVALLCGFVLFVWSVIGGGVAFTAFRTAGALGGFVFGGVSLAVLGLLYVFTQLVYAGAALEGTGATVSFVSALGRVRDAGTRRGALLAGAAIAAQFIPTFVIDSAARQLFVMEPGLRWTPALGAVLDAFTGTLFFTAVITVAAIDYRVRSEGIDLEAALEAVASA